MGVTVYYFPPTYDEIERVMDYSKDECEYYGRNHSEVYVYSLEDFEVQFNAECISDLGYIRIF